jgi:hypothetical protein
MDEKFIHIYHDNDKHLTYAIWKAWANETQYKLAVDTQLKAVQESGSEYIIVDIREFKGTTPAAQKYTTEVVMPKLYHKTKLKKIAYIVGENIFANFTLTSIRKEIDKEAYLQTNAFTSLEDAETWLLKTN